MIHKLKSLGLLAMVALLFPVIWAMTSRGHRQVVEGGGSGGRGLPTDAPGSGDQAASGAPATSAQVAKAWARAAR